MNDQMLRIGKISSINYPKGTARVTYEYRDDSTTIELPFLAWEYWMPKIGDRVVVGHLCLVDTLDDGCAVEHQFVGQRCR